MISNLHIDSQLKQIAKKKKTSHRAVLSAPFAAEYLQADVI